VIGIGLVAVVIFLIALSIPDSYLASFNTFVLLMLYFLVPWTAVNLADFYVVRKGQYAISDISTPPASTANGSQAGLVAYGLGMVSMIPFMSLSFYEGPVARALGGADITCRRPGRFRRGLLPDGRRPRHPRRSARHRRQRNPARRATLVSHVRVVCHQLAPRLGDAHYNALSAEAIRGAAALGAQVLVLPELMQSGYVFNDVQEAYALSEPLDGPTLTLWKTLASQLN
jgi:hypothetical protein